MYQVVNGYVGKDELVAAAAIASIVKLVHEDDKLSVSRASRQPICQQISCSEELGHKQGEEKQRNLHDFAK
jgi:hypothetical protein